MSHIIRFVTQRLAMLLMLLECILTRVQTCLRWVSHTQTRVSMAQRCGHPWSALAQHAPEDAWDDIARIRSAYPAANLQVMCYGDIISGMGVDAFAARVAESGANAVLSPDYPDANRDELDEKLAAYDVLSLKFVPYNLDAVDIESLRPYDDGYLFMQAVDGATGARSEVDPHVGDNISALKRAGFKSNLCAGFGVSSASDARELVTLGADGVIVGSAIISAALEGRMAEFIASLRAALDSFGTA